MKNLEKLLALYSKTCYDRVEIKYQSSAINSENNVHAMLSVFMIRNFAICFQSQLHISKYLCNLALDYNGV